MGSLAGLFGGGGLSASSSAKSGNGDQSSVIELGLSSSFVVGDGNKTSSGTADSAISQYMPLIILGAGTLVAVLLLKR